LSGAAKVASCLTLGVAIAQQTVNQAPLSGGDLSLTRRRRVSKPNNLGNGRRDE